MMTRDISPGVTAAVQSNVTPEVLIAQAIQQGLPVEMMERLLAMRKELREEQAREAFTASLSAFQGQCPIIEKTKRVLNKDGKSLRYMYAPLEAITEAIKRPLAANGLSYTWSVEHAQGFMVATCKITHVLGHSEVSAFSIPIDLDGYMTAPQKYASSQTYAKRYALCNALGISTGEEDTDATTVGKEPEAKSPKAQIVLALRALGQKTETKEQIEASVKQLTTLPLEEKNYADIVERLNILVTEKQEYDRSTV